MSTESWIIAIETEFWDPDLGEAGIELTKPMDQPTAFNYAEALIENLYAVQVTVINTKTGEAELLLPEESLEDGT